MIIYSAHSGFIFLHCFRPDVLYYRQILKCFLKLRLVPCFRLLEPASTATNGYSQNTLLNLLTPYMTPDIVSLFSGCYKAEFCLSIDYRKKILQ